MKFFFTFFFLCACSIISALNVAVTVKEPSGFSATQYPVTAMVPLPYGQYQGVSAFRLVNGAGTAIPAQFVALLRHWYRDNSIRILQIHFLADLSAKGSATFSLKDDGAGPAPANPVSVVDAGGVVTVNTGALKFTVKKTGFNLFDQVSLMPGDIPVVVSTAQQGALLTDSKGASKWFKDRTIDTFAVEENGPLRTVLRLEGYTTSYADTNQSMGFVARIYAYAGSRFVKVDFALLNGERRTWGYPIYFKDFSLVTPLSLTAPGIKIGLPGSPYVSSTLSGGKRIVQSGTDKYAITTSSGAAVSFANARATGWIDVSDAQKGVMVAQRNFWQTYPNGLEVDDQGTLRVSPWPAGKHDYVYTANYGNVYSDSSDLHWLDDMQGNRKEYLYYFHDGAVQTAELQSLARHFQWNPVASVPLNWHQSCKVTLDMGGFLPNPANPSAPSTDTLEYRTQDLDRTSGSYAFGWNNYLGNTRYVCSSGGDPGSHADFLVTGATHDYFSAEAGAMGDVNLRTHWCPAWTYDKYQTTSSMAVVNYCSGIWRSTAGQYYQRVEPPHAAGTHPVAWMARDFPHLWQYHVEEYFNYTGDLWVRDLMNFWCEFFKAFEKIKVSNIYMGESTRGTAHALGTFLLAMRITGKPEYLDVAKEWIHKLHNAQDKKYGDFAESTGGERAPFQLAFVVRTLASYMQMTEGYSTLSWQEAFNIAYGNVEWNTYYGDYGYYWTPADGMIDRATMGGSGGSFADATAWMCFETQQRGFVRSLNKTWAAGSNPYYPVTSWSGDWLGRYVVGFNQKFYKKAGLDTLPPTKITDLSGSAVPDGMKLTWSAPQDARKYHIVWAYAPIKEGPDSSLATKWWGASSGGVLFQAKAAGQRESLYVPLPVMDTTAYFAVRSFDSLNNISLISTPYSTRVKTTVSGVEGHSPRPGLVFSAFPNPFYGNVNVQILNAAPGAFLALFDIQGKLLVKWKINQRHFETAWTGKRISGPGTSSQVYLLKLALPGRVLVKKLVYIR